MSETIGEKQGRAHFGDPCIYCNTPHDGVAPGPCTGSIRISRAKADALLGYLDRSYKSGWPTPLWVQVSEFITGLKAEMDRHDETATATIEGLRGEVEALKDALTFILPMAKGYAAANRVGRNAEMIAEAEALLNPQEARND